MGACFNFIGAGISREPKKKAIHMDEDYGAKKAPNSMFDAFFDTDDALEHALTNMTRNSVRVKFSFFDIYLCSLLTKY